MAGIFKTTPETADLPSSWDVYFASRDVDATVDNLMSAAPPVATIRGEPWKTLGLGLAVFAATPVVIGQLFLTVIGWLPAVVR